MLRKICLAVVSLILLTGAAHPIFAEPQASVLIKVMVAVDGVKLRGCVTDIVHNNPVSMAKISAGGMTFYSNKLGNYITGELNQGLCRVIAGLPGYNEIVSDVTLQPGINT